MGEKMTYLSERKIPEELKGKEMINKRKTWTRGIKRSYSIVEITKSTAMISHLGFLTKIKNLVTRESHHEVRLVPKRSEMLGIFKQYHDDKGHPGRDVMHNDLKLVYGWSGMMWKGICKVVSGANNIKVHTSHYF
jgi:hypothetical protein